MNCLLVLVCGRYYWLIIARVAQSGDGAIAEMVRRVVLMLPRRMVCHMFVAFFWMVCVIGWVGDVLD